MKKNLSIALAFMFAVSLGTSVMAFEGEKKKDDGARKRQSAEERFNKMDANQDGSVSADEFKESAKGKKWESRADEMFKRLDKDSNGSITFEEYKEARKGCKGRRGGKKGKKKDI